MQANPWHIKISSDLKVSRPDGTDATPRGRKARALLAVLVSDPGASVGREAIVSLLWSDRGREQGRASLRQCLVELRTACGALLNVTNEFVGLAPGCFEVTMVAGNYEALASLDRVDPAFDHWLLDFRERLKVTGHAETVHKPIPAPLFRSFRSRRWAFVGSVGVALLAATIVVAIRSDSPTPPSAGAVSVIVGPFVARSPDQWSRTTANRLADDIISGMPQVPIIPSTEVPHATVPVASIKPSDWRVEGDVAAEPLPLVTVRIVTGKSRVLWARNFDAPQSGPSKLAGDVVAAIATMMTCATSARMKSRTDAAAALLLAACDGISGAEGWSGEAAIPALRKFAKSVPDDAFPHAMLGTGLALAASAVPEALAGQDRNEAAAELAKAAQIDPDVSIIYLGRSLLVPRSAPLRVREALLLRGLAIDPASAYLNLYMADFLLSVGRCDEGAAFALRALAVDPVGFETISETAQALAQSGQMRVALQMLDKAEAKRSTGRMLTAARFTILLRGGNPAGARAMLDKAELVPGFVEPAEQAVLRRQSYAIEKPDGADAEQIARDLVASAAADPTTAGRPVLVLAAIGQIDAAVGIALHNTIPTQVLFRPSSRRLLMDSRFPSVARRQALWAYWRSTGHWPDICRDAQLPWRCSEK